MARLVRVRGESAATYLVDLDLNPAVEERIAAKALTVVEELSELPPDPWNEAGQKVPARKAKAAAKVVTETDSSADTNEPTLEESPAQDGPGVDAEQDSKEA